MRNEIMAVKKELDELKEKSLAMELLEERKKAHSRICIVFTIIIVIMIIGYFITVGLFLKYINEMKNEETITNTKTQEIENVDNIENTNITNGDMYGDNKTN